MTRITLNEALETKGKTDPNRLAASDGGDGSDFDWSTAEIAFSLIAADTRPTTHRDAPRSRPRHSHPSRL